MPTPGEISACSVWLEREFVLLRPLLVLPVGKLAIGRFLPVDALTDVIGCSQRVTYAGQEVDCIPLPHPSGASTWHRREPGQSLLRQALAKVAAHPAMKKF